MLWDDAKLALTLDFILLLRDDLLSGRRSISCQTHFPSLFVLSLNTLLQGDHTHTRTVPAVIVWVILTC